MAIEFCWKDRRRRLGLPLSFTKYSLSEDRLFRETGFLNIRSDEVLLYRVQDLRVTRSLWQRLFGVGTVCVVSSDKHVPILELLELIHAHVEGAKDARRMRATEILDGDGDDTVHACDGLGDENDD